MIFIDFLIWNITEKYTRLQIYMYICLLICWLRMMSFHCYWHSILLPKIDIRRFLLRIIIERHSPRKRILLYTWMKHNHDQFQINEVTKISFGVIASDRNRWHWSFILVSTDFLSQSHIERHHHKIVTSDWISSISRYFWRSKTADKTNDPMVLEIKNIATATLIGYVSNAA